MYILAALVLGLLVGWLLEWIIDWFFWRGRVLGVAEENIQLKERLAALNELPHRASEPSVTTPLKDRKGNDNLQAIHGIGPAFEKRLHEAGITTFEQLAGLTPRRMEEILGKLFKRFFAKENTILSEAGEFAERKRKMDQR
jgi:predicted flap endonuclease-1-like 5' DNA nuclease